MPPAPPATASAVDAVPAAPPARPSTLAGHLALVAVQFCFGLFPVFAKFALAGLTPQAIAAWRIGVGSAVFLGLALVLSGRRALPRLADVALLSVCAVLGVVGNQVLALEGFARSTAVNAGLIMTLIPVFTFALAALFRQERFHPQRALGIPLGVLGAGILTLQGGDTPELSRQYLVGNLLMATNCLCYAGYLILSRRLLARYSPLTMIAWVYTLSLWAVPLLGYDERLLPDPAADARTVWIGLALVLTFPTVLAYLLNTFALSRVPASVTAIYIYLQPLIAGLGGILVLEERFRPAMVPAAGCMFAAIFLVTRKPRARA
ncbi:MAG: DMT family transporter [Planctomycetota bacterium]